MPRFVYQSWKVTDEDFVETAKVEQTYLTLTELLTHPVGR